MKKQTKIMIRNLSISKSTNKTPKYVAFLWFFCGFRLFWILICSCLYFTNPLTTKLTTISYSLVMNQHDKHIIPGLIYNLGTTHRPGGVTLQTTKPGFFYLVLKSKNDNVHLVIQLLKSKWIINFKKSFTSTNNGCSPMKQV